MVYECSLGCDRRAPAVRPVVKVNITRHTGINTRDIPQTLPGYLSGFGIRAAHDCFAEDIRRERLGYLPVEHQLMVRHIQNQRNTDLSNDRFQFFLFRRIGDHGAIRIIDQRVKKSRNPVFNRMAEFQDRIGISHFPFFTDQRDRPDHTVMHIHDQVMVLPGSLVHQNQVFPAVDKHID